MTGVELAGMKKVGEHIFWIEPPDILVFVLVGDVNAPEVAEIIAHILSCTSHLKYVFCLGDITAMENIPPEARKLTAAAASIPYRGMAVWGGTFGRVVLAKLALAILNFGRADDNPVRFFSAEAEARAWLEERRRAVAATG
jgi:hypothetical protein